MGQNSEKFIRDEPSLTNLEIEFIKNFIGYTRNNFLKGAIRKKAKLAGIINLFENVLKKFDYFSDMYDPNKVGPAYEISNINPSDPDNRILNFQTLQSLLEMSLYHSDGEYQIRSFLFDIQNFPELDELIKNLLQSFDIALLQAGDLINSNLSGIRDFEKFLKSFCNNYIEETLKYFHEDFSLLEKNAQHTMTSIQDLDEFNNRVDCLLERFKEAKKNIIIAKIPEKELNSWKEYLDVDNTPKLTGGYGRREDLIIGSKIYQFTDIQAACEKLSLSRRGNLKARFRAYADMYQKGAVYNYHDEYIKAENKANIQKKVSKSISSNAEFSKFIPILLKEIKN